MLCHNATTKKTADFFIFLLFWFILIIVGFLCLILQQRM